MYYANYPMTLYFQIEFVRLCCTLYARNVIKNSIKNRRENSAVKRKYYDNPEPQKKHKKGNERRSLNRKNKFRERKTNGRKKLLITLENVINK